MTVFRRSSPPTSATSGAPTVSHLAPRSSRLALEARLLFDGAGAVAGVEAFDEPLSVAEPSANNDAGAHVVAVDGWTLSGSGSVTINVTLDDPSAGTLSANGFTGSVADAQDWLNGLSFTAADVELGNTARTVRVTVDVDGVQAHRDITITPSNDPVTLADTSIDVAEGNTNRVITKDELAPVDPEVAAGTQDPSQIVYSIIAASDLPQHGYLTLGGQRLGVGSVFTQQDVIDGKLAYVHTAGGASEQNMADGFTVRINDGATPIGESDTARITLNITPVNQTPTIGGAGVVYEGQPSNAAGTGNVGQYIDGSTGGDPTDVLDTSVVRLTSLPPTANGGTLYYTGTATRGGSTQSYTNHRITQADIDAGFTFLYSARNGLTYAHDGREGVASDSFGVSITDQGGDTGSPATANGTVTLTIRPVDDDPVLGSNDYPDSALEAAVPGSADGAGHYSIVLTPGMIGARDVDTNDRNLRFIVDYNGSDIDHGHLQIRVGGTWFNIPPGESFSMEDITAGNIRYVQTHDADPGDTDQFFFKVVDSTNALRWNADGSTYDRIGGIYDDPADRSSVLTDHRFTIRLTDQMPGDDGTVWGDLDRTPQHSDSTHAGTNPVGGSGKGTLDEDGAVVLTGTSADPATDPYLSYQATGVLPEEVVYTFDGFIDDASSSDQAGELQKWNGSAWVTLNRYDTFTQKDLDAGNIRFQHDGDSEKFVSTARFTVSAGVMRFDSGTNTWVQDLWTPTFTFYIKPTNDAPTASGSSGLVIREGGTVGITTDWLTIGDPDDAASNTTMDGMEDLDDAQTRNGENNYAVDHDAANPLKFKLTELPAGGKLQYYDGTSWVDITEANKGSIELEAGWLTNDEATTRLRFVHDGSEVHTTEFKVQAIDRWGTTSTEGTVRIQVTNVNDAPQIARTPNDPDPVEGDGSPSVIGTPSANNPITVTEGSEEAITRTDLQAIDSDSSSKQVQYKITEATKYGDIMLGGKKLGVGSSFTQDDIDHGRVTYVHRGSETPDGPVYDDHFKFTLSDGDKEQTGNEFWIHVNPANDPPTVTVPGTPQRTGTDGINRISGVSVADRDLTDGVNANEEDFIQVTVRLKDSDGNVVASGFTFGHGTPGDTGGKWKADASGGLLVLQGTRAQVNAALAELSVSFTADMDAKYTLEVIADDRTRNVDGTLVANSANGGALNQPTTPGGTPGAIDGNDYDWSQTATAVPPNSGNITARTIELWSSKDNDQPVLTVPTGPVDVNEDVRSRIPGGSFVVSDAESAAFDTPVTVTITVPSGSLHIGSMGSASSVMPSGTDRNSVGIAGQGGDTLTLTGRASDIQALLNDAASTGGLYYTSASNVNHDLNSGGAGDASNGDVTVSFSLTEGDSAIGTSHGQPTLTGSIDLTIVAINDAPTVNAGSGQVSIASDQPHSVGGISIGDMDANDGYAAGETDGVIQAIVRLQRNTGGNNWAILSQADYGSDGMGIKLSSTATGSGVTIDGTFDGNDDVLVLRGTLAQINAYLAGLQVQFSNAADSNVDSLYRLEVVADDRLRDAATGDLIDTDAGAAGLQPGANGGAQNQQNGLPAVPATDSFDVYSTTVSGYGVFNVVAATRDLFVSSVNDPGKITAEDVTVNEGSATVALDATRGKFALDDSDHNGSTAMETTVTVTKGTITAVGAHADKVSGLNSNTITITGATQAEINAILRSLTITLPGADTAARQDWNGQFDVTVVYNDKGNTGLRPGALAGDSDDPRGTNGDYSYADPDGSDGDSANDNHLVTTRTITVTVNPGNDAPVVTGTGNASILAVSEGTDGGDTAKTVGELFGSRFRDDRDDVDNSGAADGLTRGSDSDDFHGVAVVGNAATAGQGVWEYSADGTTWSAISTDLADGKALILEKTAQIRFNPADDFHGTPGGLNVRLVETYDDATGTADTTSSTAAAQNPSTGAIIDLTANGGTGSTSLYSAGTIALTTTVANVNDAPSLTGNAMLGSTAEDSTGSTPMSASDIASQLSYSDATDDQTAIAGGDDAASDLTAIAITGNAADPDSEGNWQYTLDGGANWIAVPIDAANGKAIVLSTGNAEHQVRFVPAADFNGTPGGLTVRGADGTWTGTAGERDISGTIGGTHPWSADSGTVGIIVTPANDAPEFTHAPRNPTITEDGTTGGSTSVPATTLLGNGMVSDIDLPTTPDLDDDVFGAGTITVKLTSGTFSGSGDVLQIDATLDGIASVTGGSNGDDLVITLSDDATRGQVAAILAAIEYLNTSDNPTNFGDNGTRDYSITLSDGKNAQGSGNAGSGTALEKTVTGTITIDAANDPPAATPDTNSLTNIQTTVTGNVIQGTHADGSGAALPAQPSDGDPDTRIDALKISRIEVTTVDHGNPVPGQDIAGSDPVTVQGRYGALVLYPDGSYTYTLDRDNPDVYGMADGATLTETFGYTLSDGDKTDTATLTVTITGQDVTTPPGIVSEDGNGAADGHNTVHERGLGSSSDTSETTTGSIAVTAEGGVASVKIGGRDIPMSELANAADTPILIYTPLGRLTVTGFTPAFGEPISAPREGTIHYSYTLTAPVDNSTPPATDAETTDTIALEIKDRVYATPSVGSLVIQIVDDVPVAEDDVAIVDNGTDSVTSNSITGNASAVGKDVKGADDATITTVSSNNVGANTAIDDGATLTIAGEHGTMVLNKSTGAFTYSRNDGEPLTATDVFTYTLTDGDGDTDTATITIIIDDTGPVVTDGSGQPPTTQPIDPADPSGPTRLVVKPDGSVRESGLPEGSVPGTGHTTTGTIGFTPGDGNNTVILGGIPVTGVGQKIATPFGEVTITEFDPAAGRVGYEYELKAPTNGDTTTDEFELRITDADGDSSTVTVVVDIIDDMPAAEADTAELTRNRPDVNGVRNTISGNVHDNDRIGADGADASGPVTGVVAGTAGGDVAGGVGTEVPGSYGTLTLNADGSYAYELDANHPAVAALLGDQTLTDTFTYTVTDADGDTSTTTLTVTIRGNTPPVAADDVRTAPEDTPVSGNVITGGAGGEQPDGDADGNSLTVTRIVVEGSSIEVPADGSPVTVDIPGKGTLVFDKDGSYTFTPVADWHGSVPPITYTVDDGRGGTDTATLTITVTPVDDAEPDARRTESSTPVTLDPLENDRFSNPDATVTDVTQGEFGTVVIGPDGRIIYTPRPGLSGTDTFTYTVTSGGVTETTTVTIEVMPDNPAASPSDPFIDTGTPRAPDIRNPIRNSAVGDDPSPYFYGAVFDRLPRMDLPFHPIVYVNREVARSQQMREAHDARGEGDASLVEGARHEQRLSSQRLAMEHTLYVQSAVRSSSSLSERLAARVDGHRSHLNLTGDGRHLSAPELFGADVLGWPLLKGKRPAIEQNDAADSESAPQDGAAPVGEQATEAHGESKAESAAAPQDAAAMAAAPSFSEQLRSGRDTLPGALPMLHEPV
ncbi:cadherin-like domain-containing protein [Thauera sp. Sel9]|uniref:cadherin-like domain-containing protein n=1 Tax=Thauera sp. Sel9 TaxID=2974299 RepID=UPI0021E103F7|nr:cadherin-like domain-containing protein [Thauera sp. Sel9]MCV2216903.1 Ig-like domain-containing protein [Thauera sp. Sel9]